MEGSEERAVHRSSERNERKFFRCDVFQLLAEKELENGECAYV